MAIALDTSAGGVPTGSGGASPATFNYTIGSVTNPIVFLGVRLDSGATQIGATWNGVAMTLVGSVTSVPLSYQLSLYVLTNPASGNHDFSIAHTGTPNIYAFVASYSGASASGQPDASKVDQQTN